MVDSEHIREGRRLSALIDDSLAYFGQQVRLAAEAERDYRKLQGEAILRAPAGTVLERDAWLKAHCADARFTRDLADGMRQAALEAVRSRRAQLSLLQTFLAGEREEMALARTGPEVGP